MKKYNVGILGATGAVGQNYAQLLRDHPWFEITYLAASPNSAGKPFKDAVKGKWFMDSDMPKNLEGLIVGDASKVNDAIGKCDFVFSSFEGTKDEIQKIEMAYAEVGIPAVSNNSAHRWTHDVPMIIPEVNANHLQLIDIQRMNRGFDKGFVVTKPNCSIQSYVAPLDALRRSGCFPNKLVITTEQALSGAGYPGVPSLAINDNVIPYISGEDEKTEKEPLRIFGSLGEMEIVLNNNLQIFATCTRVPVSNGHLATVYAEFEKPLPSENDIIKIWENYSSISQDLDLPFAPKQPIIYRSEEDRPQPRKDRDSDKAMAVTVGRLKKYNDNALRFVGLSHNTVRGAAGGAILTAELIAAKGYFK
jgi:aspartate-semialdehyde dehydrogenase